MDFTFTDEQEAIHDVARKLFETRATPERLTEIEAGDVRFDAELWQELAGSDLLGIALPESVGGNGGSVLDLSIVLAEVGWSVAPVPVYASLLLGADTIARHGDADQVSQWLTGVGDGSRILTAALSEPGGGATVDTTSTRATSDGTGWRISGAKELVPAAQIAHAVVVPALLDDGDVAFFVVPTDAAGVSITPVATTNGEPHADIDLADVAVAADQRIGATTSGRELLRDLVIRAQLGLAAVQIGVTDRALQLAAQYTTQREQFGRPIGSFQAVQQRLADAFIDVESIRWTTFHAAWLYSEGRDAEREAAIAKYWAAEAGPRVVASAQQVHGGMGIDVTYPLHRYFLWGKTYELSLGSAPHQLAELGHGLVGAHA